MTKIVLILAAIGLLALACITHGPGSLALLGGSLASGVLAGRRARRGRGR